MPETYSQVMALPEMPSSGKVPSNAPTKRVRAVPLHVTPSLRVNLIGWPPAVTLMSSVALSRLVRS